MRQGLRPKKDSAGDGVGAVGQIGEAKLHVAAEQPNKVLAVVEGAGQLRIEDLASGGVEHFQAVEQSSETSEYLL